MTRQRARLYGLLLFLAGTGIATGLILTALRENISYFRTPSEIVSHQYPEYGTGHGLRLGGLVEKGSLHHDGQSIVFRVSDLKHDIEVRYQGVVPNLFREGQGVVAEGKVAPDGSFTATRLLAKHDEKYMPPEVARELKSKP